MKLLELFLDKIAETRLFEMAHDRQKAKDIVTGLSPQIVEHLVKLFVVNDPLNNQHWRKEIDGWLNKIDGLILKHSGKPLDSKTSYYWLTYDNVPQYDTDFIHKLIKRLRYNDPNIKLHDVDYEFVMNKIFSIIEQVCKDIERQTFISVNEYL